MNKDWLDIDVLEDYLDGKLDGKAMHFVEKQALEDPFIAEALEGLRQSPKRKQNFSILQKKLHDRIAQQPIRRKIWSTTTQRLSIAATATVVFIAVSILFFMRENNRKNAEFAERRAKGVEVNIDSKTAIATTKPETKNTPSVAILEKSTIIDKAIADAKKDNLAVNSKKIAPTKGISALPMPIGANEEIATKREKSFAPVQSAKQADVYAAKALDSSKKVAGAAKDQQLSEVVVVGYGVASKKAVQSSAKVSAKNAEMLGGKVSGVSINPKPTTIDYEKYLATNNRLLNKSDTTGKVTLSFKINKKGKPKNIKVVKSLSKATDAEAIRLVKEGPTWLLPTNGNNALELEVKF